MKTDLRRFPSFALAAAFLLQILAPGPALAQQAALSDGQVSERLAFIDGVLKAGQPRAGTWYYGWIGTFSAGALITGVLAGSHWYDTKVEGSRTVPDQEFAKGMLVAGASFALGAGVLLIYPFLPAHAPGRLKTVPEGTPDERRAKLEQAEKLLRDCARSERWGRSLTMHLLNIGGNVAGALLTKAALRQTWNDAAVNFITGEAVSLVSIYSQPMQATRDLENYEAGYLGKGGTSGPARPERKWSLSVGPGGFTFRYEF